MKLLSLAMHRLSYIPQSILLLGLCMTSFPGPIVADGLQVICAPDSPLAHINEAITIRAWASDTAGLPITQPIRWSWSPAAGTITGDDVAIWSFKTRDAPSGCPTTTTATVTAQSEGLGRASCQIKVTLAWARKTGSEHSRGAETGETLASGHTLLTPSQEAPKEYGLYSYLLLARPPISEDEKARYQGAIRSYLLQVQPISEMERYCEKSQLNLMILPVKERVRLPDNINEPDEVAESTERLLAVYDYARAQSLLARYGPDGMRTGPYLISILPNDTADDKTVLRFDMSRVIPYLIPDWLDRFCDLANTETSESDIKLDKLARNFRLVLAVMAKETPEVISSLSDWVQVLVFRKR